MKFSESDKSANRTGNPPISTGAPKHADFEELRNGDTRSHGEHPLVNGNYASNLLATPTGPYHQDSMAAVEVSRQLPPEIQHISSGYVSLSALIERLAQETFNDLGKVINDMAEMPAEQPRPNGVLNHVNHQVNGIVPGKSEANVQKKLRMLNFTNNWRPKFIKILVLSQWARQAEAVSRVIDLKNWEDMQRLEYTGAVTAMGELKRGLVAMKEPSPDTKSALEVLLLGKASWLRDFNYLKAEPLQTQQLLDTLRRINTLLSIRLNLYETIPPVFRDFSIASGRATFRIPDEFEVDLSLGDEDPTSQLFFVDFRFKFLPSVSALPPGMLRSELETRANDVLGQEGLQGLFDLLHNLVLTHKLNIMKSQAYDLARRYWSEHLVVEPVRRSVVVQYWSNRPGGKNWIEIGVRRGDEERVAKSETRQKIPSIGMRCFRGSKEVHDMDVHLRLGDLSMELILKQVIARHSSHIFGTIATKLLDGLLYSNGCLKVRFRASNSEPSDASLLIQLAATTAIKIIQEPVTGRFVVQPSSQLYSRAEYELNRLVSPIAEAFPQLAYLRSLVSVEEVETSAREIGWQAVKSLSPAKEEMQKHFPKATLQTRFFRRQEWHSRWILAFTTSFEGDSWWVIELSNWKSSSKEPGLQVPNHPLKAAYSVFSKEKRPLVFSASNQTLTQIEWTAVGMIAQHSDAREIGDGLRHNILVSSTGVPTLTMLVHIPKSFSSSVGIRPSLQNLREKVDIPEPHETVRLLYKGLDATTRSAVHVAIARVNKPISPHFRDIASRIPNLVIARLPIDGGPIGDASIEVDVFKFMLVSKVGESCIPHLISRLIAVERLLDYVSVLESNGLVINSASLSHIKFTYASSPNTLNATIDLSADAPLRLSFPNRSPHLRVRDYLTLWLSKDGLVPVLALLRMTLPVLNAFTAVEKVHRLNDINIIARSEQWYEFRYSSPIPKGGFDINLRLRRDEPYWFIKESSIKKTDSLVDEEAWTQSLRTVTRGKGRGWRGMKGGIVAQTTDGIGEALEKLDEVFRNAARLMPEEPRQAKRKAESQVVEID